MADTACSTVPWAVRMMTGVVVSLFADSPQHLHAVDSRHADVGDDQVESGRAGGLQTLLAGVGGRHVVAGVGENVAHDFAQAGVVVDDQDPRPWFGSLLRV